MRRKLLFVSVALMFLVSFSLVAADQTVLRLLYFQWDPGNAVQKVAAEYEAATKGKVKVEVELPSFTDWYNKWLANIQAQDYQWDLVVIDSQWIGMAVAGNAVVDLTDLIGKKPFVKQIPDVVKPYYMGDPSGKGRIWSVPLEADAELLFYRTDLMNNATEKANFKKRYGYDLQVPKTWFQLRDISEFFTRPDQKLWGYISKFGKGYDVITWDFAQVLWCFGGEYWDRATRTAQGYINSPKSVEGLEFYKSLTRFAPPGWPTAEFDATVNSMSQGIVMFAIEWSSFAPSMFNPKNSKVWDKVGVAVPPAGPAGHWVSLGGQPLTISAFSTHKKEAADFIEWFYKPENIWKYAQANGHPSYTDVLKDPKFWKILPQNKALWEALPFVKDVWNTQGYDELLTAAQELLNSAVTGNIPVKDALDQLAERNQATFDSYFPK
jgi:multiple sugar transport system substrate-binding protein